MHKKNNPYNAEEGAQPDTIWTGYGITFETVQAFLFDHNCDPEMRKIYDYYKVNNADELESADLYSYLENITNQTMIDYFNSDMYDLSGLMVQLDVFEYDEKPYPDLNKGVNVITNLLQTVFEVPIQYQVEFDQMVKNYCGPITIANP